MPEKYNDFHHHINEGYSRIAPDISIIIVSWNTRDLLRNCLHSISAYTSRYSYEIWVVDNNSQDGTVEMLRSEFAGVQVIANECNTGFARANNQAFALAHGRYIAVLNPDTELLNDAFDQLLDYLEGHQECGAVGPKLINVDGSFQGVCARISPSIRTEFRKLIGNRSLSVLTNENQNQDRGVEALSGACMVLRRAVLGDTLFDERYFMFVEDLELCWRLRRKSDLVYLASAHVLHLDGQSSKQSKGLLAEESYGAYLYFRSTKGMPAALVSRFLRLVTALIRIPKGVIIWVFGDREYGVDYLKEMFGVLKWAVGFSPSVSKNRTA